MVHGSFVRTQKFLAELVVMNVVKEIQRINKAEIELGVSEAGSWHQEYKHSAYVYIGGLDVALNEGDVIVVFSQFGEVVDCNLIREKETGKSRGFCFLAYEDQRSTNLAVDNFNGAVFKGRTLRVDHAANYKRPRRKKSEKNEDNSEDEVDSIEEYDEKRKEIWDYEQLEEKVAPVAEAVAEAQASVEKHQYSEQKSRDRIEQVRERRAKRKREQLELAAASHKPPRF